MFKPVNFMKITVFTVV